MYVARLSYSAQSDEIAFDTTFDANPADLTDQANFMECASHYVNSYVAELPDAVASVSLSAEESAVTFYFHDGDPLTVTIVTHPGELLDVVPEV